MPLCRLYIFFILLSSPEALIAFQASHYESPAGTRPVLRRVFNAGILPGGRILAPQGKQFLTGPGPFGLAVSPEGKVATANLGPERPSITLLQMDKKGTWLTHNFLAARPSLTEDGDWHAVFTGIAFAGEKQLWISEGNSGRIRLLDAETASKLRVVDLNQNGAKDSFAGDLAFDAARGLLYVVDQANFRVVAVDTKKGKILSSVKVGRLPFAITLSEDGQSAFVTNVGVFEYQPIPGADFAKARETGLPFPAFGFPSEDAVKGVTRQRQNGTVTVAGLGDQNRQESNSVCFLNLSNPNALKVEGFVKTGKPFGPETAGGSSPSGVLAAAGKLYVSNAHNDSISVIDIATRKEEAEIPIAIPGLEKLRGIMPLGLAFDAASSQLLVAEAGVNAIGVLDTKTRTVLGHIPTAWFPTRVAVQEGSIYVACAKGYGTGPNLPGREAYQDGSGLIDILRRGSVSIFPMPPREQLAQYTGEMMKANGFLPVGGVPDAIPEAVKYVVLIVKENRTFDEMLGDMPAASNGAVAGTPRLARFGLKGFADGSRTRLSIHNINVTPNHHSLASRWSFSDNFYADGEVSLDGHHWLLGNYPDAWTESSMMAAYAGQKDFRLSPNAPGRLSFAQSNASIHPEEIPEAGTIWHHLQRNKISFRNFGGGFELAGNQEEEGEKPTGSRFLTNVPMPDVLYQNTSRTYPGFNLNIPDQFRADQFIAEITEQYAKPGKELPRFLLIHLPNDHMTNARPADGYPYPVSYVADNDYALGRIVEYLSHSPWWKQMAIFVTESDAQGGRDHIDGHRTVLLGIGPYCKKNYVLHRNTSFPGLLKTVFRILGLPPLNLFDATATDLSEAFTSQPDFSPYSVLPVDPQIFLPAQARDPLDSKPSEKTEASH